jgi:hypothetical protein
MRTVLKPKLEVHVMNAASHVLAHEPGMIETLVKRVFKAVDNILGGATNPELLAGGGRQCRRRLH